MTRLALALMVAVAWLSTPPKRRSLLWRIPVAAVLVCFAALCFALDAAWGRLKRLATKGR